MADLTIHEFDAVTSGPGSGTTLHQVPVNVYAWLETLSLRQSGSGAPGWLRLTQRQGQRAVQLTSYVGVVRAPCGFQIEVLPKTGTWKDTSVGETRQLLVRMLACLGPFRHIQIDSALLSATRMPLLEVFIGEFLRSVEHLVKRGLQSGYVARKENLFALRGKLMISDHLRLNCVRADRFYAAYDEFLVDRPENRLIQTALRAVIRQTTATPNLRLALQLQLAFSDVPPSLRVADDLRRARLDRGMSHYTAALAWVRLILANESPSSASGRHEASSLLFPMQELFEAFVAKSLRRQMRPPLTIKVQSAAHHLVEHEGRRMFRLEPDLLVLDGDRRLLVLDTKWKLIDGNGGNGTDKYGLSQADLYQLRAYGQSYLDRGSDVILIYPMTKGFDKPLPPFNYLAADALRLWVLPFCLRTGRLIVPSTAGFAKYFRNVEFDSPAQPAIEAEV